MQEFPIKPVRFVTGGVGGGSDFATRLIAQGISGSLGQPVIVENRIGSLAAETVAKATPDGYTLYYGGRSLWIGHLLKKTPYDPLRDFSPITLTTLSPCIVVVHPSVPANSIMELIDLARARPGELKYASGLNGSDSQLAGVLFTHMAGVNMVRIPYDSGGLVAVKDVIAGKIQMMIPSAGSAMPQIKLGTLRALAVTSAEPSALAPGLPTVAASGLPGYEATQTIGVFAPAKTPATVIQRLNQEIVRFLKTADAREQLLNAGLGAAGSTPEELAAKVRSEITLLGKVIKDTGIRAN